MASLFDIPKLTRKRRKYNHCWILKMGAHDLRKFREHYFTRYEDHDHLVLYFDHYMLAIAPCRADGKTRWDSGNSCISVLEMDWSEEAYGDQALAIKQDRFFTWLA